MKIKSILFLLLTFAFALGSCESKKQEQMAGPQVSKETSKQKPAEAAPPDPPSPAAEDERTRS